MFVHPVEDNWQPSWLTSSQWAPWSEVELWLAVATLRGTKEKEKSGEEKCSSHFLCTKRTKFSAEMVGWPVGSGFGWGHSFDYSFRLKYLYWEWFWMILAASINLFNLSFKNCNFFKSTLTLRASNQKIHSQVATNDNLTLTDPRHSKATSAIYHPESLAIHQFKVTTSTSKHTHSTTVSRTRFRLADFSLSRRKKL